MFITGVAKARDISYQISHDKSMSSISGCDEHTGHDILCHRKHATRPTFSFALTCAKPAGILQRRIMMIMEEL